MRDPWRMAAHLWPILFFRALYACSSRVLARRELTVVVCAGPEGTDRVRRVYGGVVIGPAQPLSLGDPLAFLVLVVTREHAAPCPLLAQSGHDNCTAKSLL